MGNLTSKSSKKNSKSKGDLITVNPTPKQKEETIQLEDLQLEF